MNELQIDSEPLEDPLHQEIVEDVKKKLAEIGLPTSIPPHTVSTVFYHPDACTRINHKFVTIEVINTAYGFDVLGQLSLLLEKDIVEYAVCIISRKLIELDKDKYSDALKEVCKLNRYCQLKGELVMLSESEYESWFKQKVIESKLWKPSEVIKQ